MAARRPMVEVRLVPTGVDVRGEECSMCGQRCWLCAFELTAEVRSSLVSGGGRWRPRGRVMVGDEPARLCGSCAHCFREEAGC